MNAPQIDPLPKPKNRSIRLEAKVSTSLPEPKFIEYKSNKQETQLVVRKNYSIVSFMLLGVAAVALGLFFTSLSDSSVENSQQNQQNKEVLAEETVNLSYADNWVSYESSKNLYSFKYPETLTFTSTLPSKFENVETKNCELFLVSKENPDFVIGVSSESCFEAQNIFRSINTTSNGITFELLYLNTSYSDDYHEMMKFISQTADIKDGWEKYSSKACDFSSVYPLGFAMNEYPSSLEGFTDSVSFESKSTGSGIEFNCIENTEDKSLDDVYAEIKGDITKAKKTEMWGQTIYKLKLNDSYAGDLYILTVNEDKIYLIGKIDNGDTKDLDLILEHSSF